MTTKFFSIFSGLMLVTGLDIASAAPISLSSAQMDAVTAGGGLQISAIAGANGYSPVSSTQAGVVTTGRFSVGYGAAAAFGSGSVNASTSTTGKVIPIPLASGSQSWLIGTLAYSITVGAGASH